MCVCVCVCVCVCACKMLVGEEGGAKEIEGEEEGGDGFFVHALHEDDGESMGERWPKRVEES